MKKPIEIKDKEANLHYLANPELFDILLETVNAYTMYSRRLKCHEKSAYEFLLEQTKFLDVQNPNVRSRLHCVFNNMIELKLCEQCKLNFVDMSDCGLNELTPRFCSCHCRACNKEIQQKMQDTMMKSYGVKFAMQDPDIAARAMKKAEKTCMERYGMKNPASATEVKAKKEQTTLARYGVKCVFADPVIKEKIKQTNLQKYGVEYVFSDADIYQKGRNACKELYGDEIPIRTQEIKDLRAQTNITKYGMSCTLQNPEVNMHTQQTLLDRYGVKQPLASPEIFAKVVDTNMKNYGVKYNMQRDDIRAEARKRYTYEADGKSLSFDSSVELAVFIYLSDNNIEYTYQPPISFKYIYENEEYVYKPDFIINGKVTEIKGDHFFEEKDPTKRMICPWDHTLDSKYEAKHQCMLSNGVQILTSIDYQKYLDYVSTKYGKDYLKQFKNS